MASFGKLQPHDVYDPKGGRVTCVRTANKMKETKKMRYDNSPSAVLGRAACLAAAICFATPAAAQAPPAENQPSATTNSAVTTQPLSIEWDSIQSATDAELSEARGGYVILFYYAVVGTTAVLRTCSRVDCVRIGVTAATSAAAARRLICKRKPRLRIC